MTSTENNNISSVYEQDDAILQLQREREELVRRYKAGPNSNVDDWEEPKNESYHNIDSYGFYQ